jgi:hypothetical protein
MDIDHQMFLRPPRWGKSLFIDMLACYLDHKLAKKFDVLFGDTEIVTKGYKLKHKNQFHVILFDLSVDAGNCKSDQLMVRLEESIRNSVRQFCSKYDLCFDDSLSALGAFKSAIWQVEDDKMGKVFVLIDEYDRFANKVMFEQPGTYSKVVSGRSGDAFCSPVRSFFECIKGLQNVRSFTVGLSPIALADASSANFVDDITDVGAVGDLLGLTEVDVRNALHKIFGLEVAIDPLVDLVKRFYNGYHYRSDSASGLTCPLYHTQLCLYFFRELCRDREFRCKAISGIIKVEDMTDSNSRVGENVINLLIRQREMAGIICQLHAGESVFAEKVSTFTLRQMLSEVASRDLIVSFMRWHGLLTRTRCSAGQGMHKIPNEVVGACGRLMAFVEQEMCQMPFNVRSVINAPSGQKVLDMHKAVFETMTTRFDNSISETAIAGFAEVRLRVQGHYEGFRVVCEGSVTGWKRFDLMLVDPASESILLLKYKRLRPGSDKVQQDLSLQGRAIQLFKVDSVTEANNQLLQFEIMPSKQKFHNGAKTVQELVRIAWNQVSTYAELLLSKPIYSNYKFTRGVVIHATTSRASRDGEIFTSVIGVWLESEMGEHSRTAL